MKPQLPSDMPDNSLLTYNPARLHPAAEDERRNFMTTVRSFGAWTVMESVDGVELPAPDAGTNTFTLEVKIGEGGFGEVWRACQHTLGRQVAVKRLKKKLREDSDSSQEYSEYLSFTFEMEAITTAALEHPNIVPIHDLGVDDEGRPLLAMKLVRGRPWDEVLREDYAELSYRQYIRKHVAYLVDICQAVAFAHNRGILHRDIKPAQVMIGQFGEVLLMDWGLAVVYDKEAIEVELAGHQRVPTTHLDSAPNPAGTAAFMAPEQTDRSTEYLGPWTDVYLLGGTLYYVLTLKPPHEGKAAYALAQASMGACTPLKDQPQYDLIPAELREIVTDCLKANVDERKSLTAEVLVQRLQDYLTGAGAQDKAEERVAQAEDELERGGDGIGYESLVRCESLIREARGHWKDHPRYGTIDDEINLRFARKGLETGDLTLAYLHAEQISDEETRDGLLRKVVDERQRREAVHRHRRQLVLISAILAVLVIGGMIYFNSLLSAEHAQLEESLGEQSRLNHEMGERVKELTCLYGVTEALQRHDELDEVFSEVCRQIPPAWQYPEVTTARLTFEGEVFTSMPFASGKWSQSAPIVVFGEGRGLIEVFYTEEKPPESEGPFLDEERQLLDGLARLLADAVEKREIDVRAAGLTRENRERRKELRCLYGVVRSLARRANLADVIEDCLVLIPPAWQYPDVTVVRITHEGGTWESLGFRETEWRLAADLLQDGEPNGAIEVFYTEEKPSSDEGPFLAEERNLINALARLVSTH